MGIISRLFGRGKPSSREIAKERLQLVLVHDRARISPQLLDTIKSEIITVISRHIDIDQEGTEVTLSRGRQYQKLVANIPLRSSRSKGSASPANETGARK